MTPMVPITMFGWLLIVPIMFIRMSPRRAVAAAFVIGWLLLPMYKYELPGPDYSKASATCAAVVLGALIFDSKRLLGLSFCPSLIDIPMILWCLCPIATAIYNAPELTLYDGFSASFEQFVTWGLPYLIGRMYFGHLKGLGDLTIAVYLGGLLYVPLCLIEMRFSPQLHQWIYGFHQHGFEQTMRDDGYRPMVFMEHGLAVAMYMTTASLAGVWLWNTKAVTKILGMPILWSLVPLVVTSLLLKSMAALFFLFIGLGILFISSALRTRVMVWCLLLVPVFYVAARVIVRWDANNVIQESQKVIGPARVQSLSFRFINERMIATKAEQQRTFGWGLYGRAFVKDWMGNIVSVPDSLWIITYGQTGWVGLVALGSLMIPIFIALFRLPAGRWAEPQFVGLVVFAVQLGLYAIDNLLNNMPNPIFLLGLGGLSGLVATPVVRNRVVAARNAMRLERLLADNFTGPTASPIAVESFQRSTNGH